MKIEIFILTFGCAPEVKNRPDLLRGYFGRRFEEYTLMHHHAQGNKYLYRYPLVQYKILNRKSIVLGIKMGAELLNEIYRKVDTIEINSSIYEIFEKDICVGNENLGYTSKSITYSFLTHWLALNEENYKRYVGMNPKEKKQLLSKILVGNILSMAKGLEYVVTDEIKVSSLNVREVPARLKGVPMIGFMGTFSVNFEIPDYFGIGKSVSRGFGTVKKV